MSLRDQARTMPTMGEAGGASLLPIRGPGSPRPAPFDARICALDGRRILLLPSPYAAILRAGTLAWIAGPHRAILPVEGAEWLASARPEMIKLLFGRPSRFVDQVFGQDRVALLSVFDGIEGQAAIEAVLRDGRRSVAELPDERLFVGWWEGGMSGPAEERRLERACQRYAGINPASVRGLYRIGRSLADYLRGEPTYLDHYADQSHFIREAKRFVSTTPGRLRKMSALFYFHGCAVDTLSSRGRPPP